LIVLRVSVTLAQAFNTVQARQTTTTRLHIGYLILGCSLISSCGGFDSKQVPSEIGQDSRFGAAVRLATSFKFVGAPGHGESGAVFVYPADGDGPPSGLIVPFQGASGDEFGRSIAVDDDLVLIGAPIAEIDGFLGGGAFIYRHEPEQDLWIQNEDFYASSPSDLDYFGTSLAISGDVIAIGSPGDDELGSNAGAVFMYVRDQNEWSLPIKLVAPEGGEGDRFGESVALDSGQLLVGSPFARNEEARSGLAYLFKVEGASSQLQKVLVPGSTDSDQAFGSSVALTQNHAFVGAPGPGNPAAESGTVSIFSAVDGATSPEQTLSVGLSASESGFGASLDAEGEFLVVGAQRMVGNHSGPGSAFMFRLEGSTWSLARQFAGPEQNRADGFGQSVSIKENRVAVGAAGDGTAGANAGAVYFYRSAAGDWD
jgi:hypothetical protein